MRRKITLDLNFDARDQHYCCLQGRWEQETKRETAGQTSTHTEQHCIDLRSHKMSIDRARGCVRGIGPD
jgi:hypothetical protein